MIRTCDVGLQTDPGSLQFSVRGNSVVRYDTACTPPGFRNLRVAERLLTSCDGAPAVRIGHGNVNGLSFVLSENSGFKPPGELFTRTLTCRRGSASVGFRHEMSWCDSHGNPAVHTTLTSRIAPACSGGATIDLCLQFMAPDTEPVHLGQTDCALLSMRLAGCMQPRFGGLWRNGLGDCELEQIEGRRSAWISCTGVTEGATIGVVVLDHPDNLTYPSAWRIADDRTVAAAAFETCSMTLLPRESVAIRYRIQTYADYVDDAWASARAGEFADEPLRL